MVLITFFFLLLCIALLIYKRSVKTIIVFTIILFSSIGYFLSLVSIEDYYGRNNHIYFDGKENDTVIILDRTTKQVLAKGQIQRKSWDRVFIKHENDTLDLNDWIEQKAGYMADVTCELK